MPTIFKPVIANPTLFTEIARTTLDIDPVLFFYGGATIVLAVLWSVGCLAFGRAA